MKKRRICSFCNQNFEVKINTKIEQKFCKDQCRNDFHSYGRKYVSMLIETGQIDFTTIKDDFIILYASIVFRGKAVPLYFSMRKYPKFKSNKDGKSLYGKA